MIEILSVDTNLLEMLNSFEDTLLSQKLPGFTAVSISIAAFCTCIGMLCMAYDYLNPKSDFHWFSFFRPIVLFVVVAMFNPLVIRPVNAVTGHFATLLSSEAGGSFEKLKTSMKENIERECEKLYGESGIVAQPQEEIAEDSGTFTRAASWCRSAARKLTQAYLDIRSDLSAGFVTCIASVILFLLEVFASYMIIIGRVSMMLMDLVGPITFSIAILAPFGRGIKLWIERFIQYALWQPLIYLMLYIGTEVMSKVYTLPVSSGTAGFAMIVCMTIVVFALIKQIPAWASFIIESSGAESAANAMIERFSSTGRSVAGAVVKH